MAVQVTPAGAGVTGSGGSHLIINTIYKTVAGPPDITPVVQLTGRNPGFTPTVPNSADPSVIHAAVATQLPPSSVFTVSVSDQVESTTSSAPQSVVTYTETPGAVVIGDPSCISCVNSGDVYVVSGTVTVTDTETTTTTQHITRTVAIDITRLPPPVNKTTTALSASPNPAVPGQEVTYTATVSPTPDGGTVTFTDAGNPIGGCTAVPVSTATGKAVCDPTYTSPGSHVISASYSGTSGFGPSVASSSLTEVITSPSTPPAPQPPPPRRGPGAPVHPAALAYTGFPLEDFILAGLGLILLGILATLAPGGATKRSSRSRGQALQKDRRPSTS